ncbi:MAG: hypothetical protein DRP85_07075 [Candidatus Makaraimicrobium thalassicum]|nr:MAG: hypothetical protein DRP85_07075 [Candidatus Omnitrophota bacterium]
MAKKILVADDEIDILTVIAFRLESLGYEVLTAVNGKEALDSIQKQTPDLILLDLRMPVMDGYEVCRRLKSDEKLKHIPVILLTASVVSEMVQKTRELEADDYVIKPFIAEELAEKIRKSIG